MSPLTQVRVRRYIPVPQVTEQVDHSVHEPHDVTKHGVPVEQGSNSCDFPPQDPCPAVPPMQVLVFERRPEPQETGHRPLVQDDHTPESSWHGIPLQRCVTVAGPAHEVLGASLFDFVHRLFLN